jgi:cytochrome c oxidase subunit 2
VRNILLLTIILGCGGSPAPTPATPVAHESTPVTTPVTPDPGRGRAVAENKGCVQCHTFDGTARVGPSWKGIWDTDVTLASGSRVHVDAAYVRKSIKTPQADLVANYPPSMPTFEGSITDRELDDVIAFIQSLK